jgi:hypothetical protein
MKTEEKCLEFIDFANRTIFLSDQYYKHVIKEHGSVMTRYSKNWEETLKNPDYIGNSKSHEGCRVYIQKNDKKRHFQAKYLIIIVNEVNLITSVRFGSNLNFTINLKEVKQ